jgi:periplasmic protein TonB
MSEKHIEKVFLYFLAFSLLLHAAFFTVLYLLPDQKREVKQESYMVELSDLPEVKQATPAKETVRRFADQKRRVVRERTPRAERERDKVASLPRSESPPVPPRPLQQEKPQEKTTRDTAVPETTAEAVTKKEEVKQKGGEGQRKGKKLPELSKLFPSAGRMARLEESYRKKYDTEVEEGETRFLNTDDIQFGSFLRRFETAVYGVWKYPEAAARAGIQGVTPVKITFNRQGEIENIQLLRSSGSGILDAEVLRTLRSLGPLGGFPKAYPKEQFHLIAFFQYGITQGGIRGSLR